MTIDKEDLPIAKAELLELEKEVKGECLIMRTLGILAGITVPLNIWRCYQTTFEPIDAFSITLMTCATYKLFVTYVDYVLPRKHKVKVLKRIIRGCEE